MQEVSVAIRFDGVSKLFTLHRERARSFQEVAVDLLRGRSRQRESFWAVEDVSFEIAQGETIGLIGPNGAGKSTILKLISRIIEPTRGRIQVHGRIGALLELGAGFHPDLTGRENIFLNGSILGLSRSEIRQKIDEIIAFAELERFIDVPVKHYSSGMYVRLGFSVAVHTNPEILLVDEVLAVGDATFQRKCLERIDQLRQQGVTILFVSHNLDAIRGICRRVVWLGDGRIVEDGAAETVTPKYIWHSYQGETAAVNSEGQRWGTGEVEISKVCLLDRDSRQQQAFASGEPMIIRIHYQAHHRIERPVFGLAIHRGDGVHITGPNTRTGGHEIPWIEGDGIVQYAVPSLLLNEGTYYVSVSVHNWRDTQMYDYHNRLYPLRVYTPVGERYGVMRLNGEWSSEHHQDGTPPAA